MLLDWRGTLAVGGDDRAWVRDALARLGRDPAQLDAVLTVVEPLADALDAPGVDADAELHARTYRHVLTTAGLDEQLVAASYVVESDLSRNPFAVDVGPTLAALHAAGLAVAVVSDLHVDLRPVFVEAGLDRFIDAYALSFEQGVQKPNPVVFARTLAALGVSARDALMIGDRGGPDGGAVGAGITTLLLPALHSVHERRLHRVLQVCGLPGAG